VSREEIKAEAAALTRQVRELLERERAQGLGDLLADGAAAAKGQPGDRPALAPKVAKASSGTPASALPSRPAAAASASPARVDATSPAAFAREDLEPMPAPIAIDLFAAEAPAAPAAGAAVEPLPPFHAPLNPIGEGRIGIVRGALPILREVAAEVNGCPKCGLCETRTKAVPGIGSPRSGIVFVGEAPGADEDRRGEPFVGRAGQLLDKIIQAMDEAKLIPDMPLNRETVYICNVLKCRPPENRNPLPHEIETCSPYLRRQLDAIQPRIICCLGKFAAELLVGVKGTIGGLRGRVYRYQGSKLIVTYHPAACLRNPGYKRPVWEDMQLLAREYRAG
jgi:DNA polymerase